jgi:hypothetical protein
VFKHQISIIEEVHKQALNEKKVFENFLHIIKDELMKIKTSEKNEQKNEQKNEKNK